MRSLRWTLAALLLLGPASAFADVVLRVPIVTQIQGAVFYRTSLTIGNATGNHSVNIALRLVYRSLVDGTFQSVTINEGTLGAYRTLFYEDIIQHFKDEGVIRTADRNASIFGTLQVTYVALNHEINESLAEARTYSPATGGGTNGIAYVGRDVETAGSEILKAALRDGNFGADGTTRANIGFVNEGDVPTAVLVTYRDGATGQVLREFTLPELRPGEVTQLNDIFNTVAGGTRSMIVRAQATASGSPRISGYGVQLDSVTNDGSFFLFAEEDNCIYSPPTIRIED
jgi:hypothetical protein